MKRLLLLLLLLCLPAFGAGTITNAQSATVLQALASVPSPEQVLPLLLKIDAQFITFSDGSPGIKWREHVQFFVGYESNCWYAPMNSSMQSVLAGIASGSPTGLNSQTDPANGKWFVTNVTGLSQSEMDWCTQ